MMNRSVSVSEIAEPGRRGQLDIIDVRTPVEYREVHAESAKNMPLGSLDPKRAMEGRSSEQPVYVICRSGARSSKAQQRFLEAGFENVVNIDGGTDAWVAAGMPVVRGKKAISLERQVRIAAGFLVFLGAVLGLAVHPYFTGISAFVGAGLMFAGITDTCAMGMLIAKMPWNRVADSASCSAA